jgi:hypothetical protein
MYEKAFWEQGFEGINLIWLPGYNVKNESLELLTHDTNARKKWYHGITNINTVYSQENVLCAYVSVNEGVDELSDQELMSQCTDLLRKFLGNQSIPYPKSILK